MASSRPLSSRNAAFRLLLAALVASLALGAEARGGARRGLLADASAAIESLRCAYAKPTLIFMSGIGGSQMVGTNDGSVPACPPVTNATVVWYADKWFLHRNLTCWSHMMSMQFDEATGAWRNSTGTELWPDEGYPDGAKQKLYYATLFKHIFDQHGYVLDKDFFVVPYDWRIGVRGLEESGGLLRIAQRISDAVQKNCGQKAIVITHSFGANVMAVMLHMPEFQQWRDDNVKGWVPVGGPFGGIGATMWLSKLSGDFFKLFPILSNILPVSWAHKLPLTIVGKSVYNFAFGLPSWTFMLPRAETLGADHVVVSTPTRNYTVMQQKELLRDMGDEAGAKLLDDTWELSDKTMAAGPVPGVETYCLYSTAVPTLATLVMNETIPKRHVMHRPMAVETLRGDGVVDLASLRMCSKFAPKDHLIEVDGPLVDHTTIISHPLGLNGLTYILNQLGVPNTKPALLPGLLARANPLGLLERMNPFYSLMPAHRD